MTNYNQTPKKPLEAKFIRRRLVALGVAGVALTAGHAIASSGGPEKTPAPTITLTERVQGVNDNGTEIAERLEDQTGIPKEEIANRIHGVEDLHDGVATDPNDDLLTFVPGQGGEKVEAQVPVSIAVKAGYIENPRP